MNIYDSVHGFIRLNNLEAELVDSLPFQRLHYIHQLGISYLVYPGGTHTRFEHSLGVMEVATKIFDRLMQKDEDFVYWRQMVRCAALCHDFGHLPFSHTAEKALLGRGGHERWTIEIIKSAYVRPIWEKLAHLFPDRDVLTDIIKLSIGEKKLQELGISSTFSSFERALSEIITGDFFGADRIDYLLRDAQCTGVAYGLIDYHQLIEMLCLLPLNDQLALGIEENGIESCEALLLARHFMYRRVYKYATARAYSFHLARFMKNFYTKSHFEDLDRYLQMTDSEVLVALNSSARNPHAIGHLDASAIIYRSKRFKAIELTNPSQEARLEEFKNQASIPEESIAWELSQKKKEKIGLSFPVLKRSGAICDASSCSEILIPSGPVGWVYISPEYEHSLLEFLYDPIYSSP